MKLSRLVGFAGLFYWYQPSSPVVTTRVKTPRRKRPRWRRQPPPRLRLFRPYVSTFGRESAHDREVVAHLVDNLSLRIHARRMLGTLSGGERQRVVIARALAQEAPVLLLDEPTSALDLGHQQHALELVDRLRRERNLIVVSAMHDLTLAGLYSDRLLLLHQGVGVARGAAQDVLRSETLAEFYGVSARVIHEADGTVVVVPQRSAGDH